MTDLTLQCELVNETELAWLVEYEGKTFWVPQSQCQLKGDELTIPEWLAIDKGMI